MPSKSFTKHICDNCGMEWHIDSLQEIKDYSLRVDAGGVVPSGECPECGCLCYPEKKVKKRKGEKSVEEAISLLEIFSGLLASLLDGNKRPDKTFLRAMRKTTRNATRNLKRLLP